MKKLMGKSPAKWTAVVLCVAGALLLAVFFSLRLLMAEAGGFAQFRNREQGQEALFSMAGDTYAAAILEVLDPEDPQGSVKGLERAFGMEFAIVKSDGRFLADVDLSSPSVYVYRSEGYGEPGKESYDHVFAGGLPHYSRYYYAMRNNFAAVLRSGGAYAYIPYWIENVYDPDEWVADLAEETEEKAIAGYSAAAGGDEAERSDEVPGAAGEKEEDSGEKAGEKGENPGNAKEEGENPGNAQEKGENPGNAKEEGEYPGNAQEKGENPGNAKEEGEYPGNAQEKGENLGNAKEEGEYPGNAQEKGEKPGNAKEEGEYQGNAREETENREKASRETGGETEAAEQNRTQVWIRADLEDTAYPRASVQENERVWVLYRLSDLEERGPGLGLFKDAGVWAGVFYWAYWLYLPAVALGILLIIGSTVFLIAAAGRREGEEGVRERLTDRMPFEILLGLCLLGDFALLVTGKAIASDFGYTITSEVAFWGGVVGTAMVLIQLLLATSFAVRVKSGHFLRNTLLWYLLRPIDLIRKAWRENVPLVVRTVVILAVLFVLQFWVILTTGGHSRALQMEVILFLLYKFLETIAVLWAIVQMNHIDQGVRRLVEGKTEEPIDTRGMYWAFKEHAERVNRMGEGMTAAVESRLRSERMKTELVANVSHDIKTPLTSIINYVDLLGKEEMPSPKASEYLDVLQRQSGKLKKLVEDLIEASKASTGNLELRMEACSLDILLSQAMGEFEEKMKAAGLTPVVQGLSGGTAVYADGRYLWRVVDNLMSNIVKYSLPGTRVYVDVSEDESEVRLQFKNISREPLNISSDELMERFVRGDASRNTEGSGLGLSIASSLTTLMGGAMETRIDGDLFKVTLTFRKEN